MESYARDFMADEFKEKSSTLRNNLLVGLEKVFHICRIVSFDGANLESTQDNKMNEGIFGWINSIAASNRHPFGGIARAIIYNHLYRLIEALSCIIRGHKEVLHRVIEQKRVVREYISLNSSLGWTEHVRTSKRKISQTNSFFREEGLPDDRGNQVHIELKNLTIMQKALHHCIVSAEKQMFMIVQRHPCLHYFHHMCFISRAVIMRYKEFFELYSRDGHFEPSDVVKINHTLDHCLTAFDQMRFSFSAASIVYGLDQTIQFSPSRFSSSTFEPQRIP